ncbi:2-keto-4-pentenoate hydratase [Rhizobacter sp. AJA081-3]|jgi:2-oxo-3-hexenedioate decarboxylase|uniref:2-keto-4-pentenoate hydratase n=1 Tax=Rhizobacter sp. AJA081-3 TaxID=2753607 RepID=UPI001FD7262B|nr:hydratase [Rhizobacter sp. AJA081-3]
MPTLGLAAELLAAYDAAGLIPLPSERDGGLTVAQAYEVGDQLRLARLARGEQARGYKIGFTNRTIWPRYNVFEPIWAPVWERTVRLLDVAEATTTLQGLVQPRLEPEIVFGFRASPRAGMNEAELSACLAWVAHGYEIVHTHFEAWRFTAADTVADFALHGRLLVGPRVPVDSFAQLGEELAALELTLACDGQVVDTGHGRNVLDGPLNALRLWVDAMAQRTPTWPLGAGDIVTTGTLTDAWPMAPGQVWQSRPGDARLPGLRLTVTR